MTREKAVSKFRNFVNNPCDEYLLTISEYEHLSAFSKGYVTYYQASWKNSTLPDQNPFKEGTRDYNRFNDGSRSAMMEVQESE